ncbi:hypothetical protein HDF18_11475 [Mucilaginibacter sp. X5P1]|uniref:hypothetical protein n=1 Tax=Mucilaginibacter sp. X5P1 TaxID=2723088 RepID=UPI00160B99E0|nr:hypothetical protein [Mucilaginibacter sp. X5P1]MBB6140565.1 DNA-directed RNA polymerase subunit RPC12/RpoP [Mucilaginibacter sp. X5P1]
MATEIKAIECPKCGSTQKYEVRPGDYKCTACGTEYFLDNGTVTFSNPLQQPVQVQPAKPGCAIAAVTIFVLVIAVAICVIVYLPSDSTTTSSGQSNSGSDNSYSWDISWAGQWLYLSTDKRPILFTIGTKTYGGDNTRSKDYIAFYDLGLQTELKLLPMPGASALTHEHGGTNLDVREFSNGDMYIISDNLVISKVTKSSLSVTDVTQSLFEHHTEMSSGLAKAEFADNDYAHGNGFKVFTNDGKNYFYFPLTDQLCTKEELSRFESPIKTLSQGNDEKTAFDFSNQSDYDHPEIGARLISYQYLGDKIVETVPVPRYSPFFWNNEQELKEEGVISHKDFTPARIYFEQQILYFDDDYVLICLKQSPAESALRYLQCLDAHSGAIIFTTPLKELYPPDKCVRYNDGFAMVDAGNTYKVDFKGKFTKYIPGMYKANEDAVGSR